MAAWPVGNPQQLHGNLTPPASRWALPIACDALNARTVAIGEYLAFCVSSPMRCQAHFAVRVGIARFGEGHSEPAVRLGTEGMYLSAFMLRRSCLPGFLFQRPVAEGGKGNTPCFWLLHRQYLEGSYNTDTQLRFQLVPHGFVYTEKFISVCILYGTGRQDADITAVVPQDSVQGIRFAADGFQNGLHRNGL